MLEVSSDQSEKLSFIEFLVTDEDENLIDCEIESCNTAIVPELEPSLANTTFFQTLMHLIKSNVGAGILNLPIAMSRAGTVVGPVTLFLFAIPVLHCMELLLDASKEILARYNKKKVGFAGTTKYAFLPYLGRFSSISCYIVNAFLIFSQIGFCSACLLFASETVYMISKHCFNKRIWILIIWASMTPFALIKNLKTLSVISMLANILCLSGLIGTVVGIIANIKSPAMYPKYVGGMDIVLYFTSLMYAYEGIGAVLPLYNEMKKKHRFILSLRLSVLIVMIAFFVIGFIGYIAFGNTLTVALTLSLPDATGYNIVKILYAQGVYLSFFLQLYVALSIVVPSIKRRIDSQVGQMAYEYGMTYFLMAISMVIIQTVPNLDDVINLIGSVCCASLCFILPPVIHTAVFLKAERDVRQRHLSIIKIIKNVTIILFGMVLCVAGFYATLMKILKEKNLQA